MIEKLPSKISKLLLVFLLTDLLCSVAFAQDRQTVKIGLIFPLTGPMSSFGEDISKAAPLLEATFNAQQSKYKFVLILEDGKFGKSNAAITAAKKLVSIDGVKFLVVGSSGETLQVAPYAESAQIVTVAGFSSHPDVKKSGDYIFRTYIDIERGIRLVADDMLSKKYNRIAIISEESSFTLSIKKYLHEFLGNKITFSEDSAFGEADFKTLIAKARSRRPEVYYLNVSTPTNFVTLVRQLRDNGVREPFYTYYTPSLQDVQSALGQTLDGTKFLDFPNDLNQSQEFSRFLAEFEQQTGGPARALFNFKTNYNAVKVIFDGIMAVGADATKVKEFLYSYDRQSATGLLQFDANGDVKNLNLVIRTFNTK